MFPDYPYPGFTWQISQHIAIVQERYILGLLRACAHLERCAVDPADIDAKIAEGGIIASATGRSIWRDYQQVLCEFGLMYATNAVGNEIRFTPIAKTLLSGKITFSEVLAFQLLKYQYPNAYKNTISKNLKSMLPLEVSDYDSLVAVQEHFDIKIRPLPFLWLLLDGLRDRLGREVELSTDEVATYVFRCTDYNDAPQCIESIMLHWAGQLHLTAPDKNIKRNASDWFALMSRTKFFTRTSGGLKRSATSIRATAVLKPLFQSLCDNSSFWGMGDDGVLSWYENYGSVDCPLKELVVQNGKQMWDFFPSIITTNVISNYKSIKE